MKEIVDRLFKWMDQRHSHQLVSTDATVYQVETITHIYCGQILFQDDVKLKIKTEGPRVVKVLKQNIQRIVIVKSELNSKNRFT